MKKLIVILSLLFVLPADAKENIFYTSPTSTDSLIDETADTVATFDVSRYTNVCIWIKNVHGSKAFTDADIKVSGDGTDFISLTFTTYDTLAAGGIGYLCWGNNAYKSVKVLVTGAATANETAASTYFTANNG